ncbi:hypothetical protein ACS0TY_033939 [Phlomoides rotata]
MASRWRGVRRRALPLPTTNYLMLLSGSRGGGGAELNCVFECKTCNWQFPSFLALDGHRASHKKPRLMADGDNKDASPPKPKTHKCSVCNLEFLIGQALGGHMRRHWSAAVVKDQNQPILSLSPPIVKKSNIKSVLNLNLTPLENKFLFGQATPAVDCFF